MTKFIGQVESAPGEKQVLAILFLPRSLAITLSAAIAAGMEKGAESCLPASATAHDRKLFKACVPYVLEIGEQLLDEATKP